MHLTHLIRIAYQLLLLITFLILCVTLRENADRQTKAREVDEGRIEFAANRRAIWAWILLVIYLIYATIRQLNVSHGRPLDLIGATGLGALALVAAFSFPYTILVAPTVCNRLLGSVERKRFACPHAPTARSPASAHGTQSPLRSEFACGFPTGAGC